MTQSFADTLLSWGAPGLFFLALVDSGALPIPQGVDVLLFAQATANPSGALLYAALATAGSLAGCLFLRAVSRRAGEAALARRVAPEKVAQYRGQMERYDALTLLLPTMIPLPLPTKLFIIASGVFRVGLGRFTAAVLVGRTVRFFGIAMLAQRYGDQAWSLLRQNALAAAAAIAVLLALFYWLSRRFR